MRPIHPSRRTLLKYGGAFGAMGLAGAAVTRRAIPASAVAQKFQAELSIPPVLAPIRSDMDADYYEIVQRQGMARILPGLETLVWGYNGTFPGPTIRARRGQKAIVRHVNSLSVPTVVHLHGGVTPSDSDGFPTDLIVPAGFPGDVPLCSTVPSLAQIAKSYGAIPENAKVCVYPNDQRAATLWYHDHAMDFTGRNVFMGLAGFYLIEDEQERALNLPVGAYDVPVMICVRAFAADGSFAYDHRGHLGAQGDVVLVNGVPWPRLSVERRKYRFRFLNASNASSLTLTLGSGRPFAQIATDAGLLAAPVAVHRIPLAMAERAEVVIDFAEYNAGTRLMLYDDEARQGQGGASPTAEIMCFDIMGSNVADPSALPDRLAAIERLNPQQAVRTRVFEFAAHLEFALNFPPISWNINGRQFDPNRADASPKAGDVEIWRFSSYDGVFPGRHVHPAHVHLIHFQVIERNGKEPPPHETGWKDTVRLERGDEVSVIARFGPYPGRYVMHCHNLGHEDYHMMSRFDVV